MSTGSANSRPDGDGAPTNGTGSTDRSTGKENHTSDTTPSPSASEPHGQNWRSLAGRAKGRLAPVVRPVLEVWRKSNNDWIFNWASGLAYTFLTSVLPIFLAILGIAGFILGFISPQSLTRLENGLAGGLPGGASGVGGQIVTAVLQQLHHSAGIFVIVGILGAIIAGSGLFLSLESAFGIAYRVKGRDPVPQRIMALSMVLVYILLVPLMVLASVLPAAILHALQIGTKNPAGAFLIQVLGLLAAFVSAVIFFGAVYFVVPNRKIKLQEIWKGTLTASILLVVYELAFPIYVSLLLHPNNYGSMVGFAVLSLTFFYYLAFIVLLGAEVNALAIGLHPTTKSLGAMLEELQAHDEMIEPPPEDTEPVR